MKQITQFFLEGESPTLMSEIFPLKQKTQYRSSHQRCSVEKAVLKNFAIFTGKHLCCSLCLIKLQAFRTAVLLKRDSNTGVSFVKFVKFLRTPIFKNICERLLL